jgi:hypothetical protein
MPITYNIESDYLYKKAYKKAVKEEEEMTILEMLKDPTFTIEKISQFTRTTIEYVQKIKTENHQ